MGRFRLLAISVCATCVSGCGEPRYQVSGKISFSDGAPAYSGTSVVFTSTDGKRSGVSYVTQPDGGFRNVSFEAVEDGLPAGTYQVMLRPPDRINVLPEVARSAPPNFGIQEKYMAAETSGFKLTLEQSVSNYDLTLDTMAAADTARLRKGPAQSVERN
jgi:hypothetical protein